jgi:ribonuclease HII
MAPRIVLPFRKDIDNIYEAGIDEAGRGCLAGRVYTACVILPNELPKEDFKIWCKIRDSKKLNAKNREELRYYIEEHAMAWSVGYAEPDEIEEKNILQATMAAMHRTLDEMSIIPSKILVDGNYFKPYYPRNTEDRNVDYVPYETIEGGDNKYMNIAAASILAKTHHDEYVRELVEIEPELEIYGWTHNMCYGTKEHIDAIKKHGISIYHRNDFGICKNYNFNNEKNKVQKEILDED